MVVDVDDGCVRRDLLDAAARPLQVARVEEEGEKCVDAAWRFFQDVAEPGQECIHLWQRRRDEHPYLLARRAERFGECKAAAKRVPIRVLVTKDEDLLVGVDQLLDLAELVVDPSLRGRYDLPSSASVVVATVGGRTSFSSSAM